MGLDLHLALPEIPQIGKIYENKEGATQFYHDLLGAFPDIVFSLTQI